MPPIPTIGKRKRVADSEEPSPVSGRRASDRIRQASVVPETPQKHTTRASTETSENARPVPTPKARPRQVARRSGGRLPPKSDAEEMPPPDRVFVAIPPASPSAPVSSGSPSVPASQSRTRIPLSQSIMPPPSTPSRIPAAPPSSARRTRRASSVYSPEERNAKGDASDQSQSEDDVGAAGPGPATRATRARRKSLQPVPQPDPAVFHRYLETRKARASKGKATQASEPEEIIDVSSSPDEPESQVPQREAVMINGDQAYVIGKSDSDDGQPESYECPMNKCFAILYSTKGLARHIRRHAAMYDSSSKDEPSGGTPSAARKKIAELEKQAQARTTKHETEKANLQKKLAEVQTKLNDSVARQATALGSASHMQVMRTKAEEKLKEQEKEAAQQAAAFNAKIAELTTSMQVLQSKVTALDELDAELTAVAAPLHGETPSTEHQIALLHKKVKKTTIALKDAQSEADFLRDQYRTASDSAVAEVARANGLEEEVKRLKEKLDMGLKQRDMHWAQIANKATSDSKNAKAQLELLLDQSRRTDDTVRRKAASYTRLTRENEDLETELHKARSRADDLSKRNTELSDHIALLRGRLIGAFDPVERSDDETDDDIVTASAPPAIPNLVPAFAPDNNSARLSPALVDPTLADGGIEMFRCKWALEDDLPCPEIFHTRDDMEAHGLCHIDKLSAAIDQVADT